MNEGFTLQMVRAAMEKIARENNCDLTQVTNPPILAMLNTKNNGTVGALARQVKLEHLGRQLYDRADFTMEFKSAVMNEIQRFVENARKVLADQNAVVEQDNCTLREQLDTAEALIKKLTGDVEDAHMLAADTVMRLTENLNTTKQHLAVSEQAKDNLQNELKDCRTQLTNSQDRISQLNQSLGKKDQAIETLAKSKEAAESLLKNANDDREKALRAAELAELNAANRQEIINRLDQQLHAAHADAAEWKAMAADLERQLDDCRAKLNQMTAERLGDLKQTIAASKGGGEAVTDVKAPVVEKKRRRQSAATPPLPAPLP